MYVPKRKKSKKKLFNKARLVVMALIAIFLLTSTWKVYQKNRDSRSNLAAAQAELITLTAKQKTLESEYQKLQSEKGKDEEIRKKFSVTKDGEEIAVIIDDKKPPEPPPPPRTKWQKFWASVKSVF